MHHEGNSRCTNAEEDAQVERALLVHVMESRPQALRLSDLVRELGDPEDFAQRDGVERALWELRKRGVVFKAGGAIIPTPGALHVYELLNA
jgi:hypothetical protein